MAVNGDKKFGEATFETIHFTGGQGRSPNWCFKPSLKSHKDPEVKTCSGTTDPKGIGKAQGEHEGCI